MDIADALGKLAGDLPTKAPLLEAAVVTQVVPATKTMVVNASGKNEICSLNTFQIYQVGDAVLITRLKNKVVVVAPISTPQPLCNIGTVFDVSGVGGPPQVSVSDAFNGGTGSFSMFMPFLSSYTPTLGDLVWIQWSHFGPMIMGKVSQDPSVFGLPDMPLTLQNPIPPTPGGTALSGTSAFIPENSVSWIRPVGGTEPQYVGWLEKERGDVVQGFPPSDPGSRSRFGAWYYNNALGSFIPNATGTATIKIIRLPGGSTGDLLLKPSLWPWPPQAGDEFGPQGPIANTANTTSSVTVSALAPGETREVTLPSDWVPWLTFPWTVWSSDTPPAANKLIRSIAAFGSDYMILAGVDTNPEAGRLLVNWSL